MESEMKTTNFGAREILTRHSFQHRESFQPLGKAVKGWSLHKVGLADFTYL